MDVFCFFEALPLESDANSVNNVDDTRIVNNSDNVNDGNNVTDNSRGIHVSSSSTFDFLGYVAPLYNVTHRVSSSRQSVGMTFQTDMPRIRQEDVPDIDAWFNDEESNPFVETVSGQNDLFILHC